MAALALPGPARLGANESGFGPSPAAIEAIAREAQICWRYGDPEIHELRVALGLHLGLAPEAVVVGEGVDGLGSRGVFICMPGVAPLNRCIRVSAAPKHEIDIFEQALLEVL